MIRATTGGVLRGYRKNLMDSFIRDNKARNTVLSQRVFNSYAEDPAAAAKAFRLRKSRMMVNSQHDVCQGAYSKFQSAFTCLDTISKLIDTKNGDGAGCLKDTTLEMLNDPTGDARTQLSKVLDQLSQSIVQNLNQKYGDDFIFAGADGHNVPFEVKTVDGKDKLYYRGVPVDAAVPNVWKDGDTPFAVTKDGKLIAPGGTSEGCYLKMDNIKMMSVKEYEELYTLPNLEPKNVSTPVNAQGFEEYNEDGTIFEGKEGQKGGYYLMVDATGQPVNGGDKAGSLIKQEDYYAAVERVNSAPNRIEDNATPNKVVYVDKDGKVLQTPPTTDAEKENAFFMIVDGKPSEQVMTEKEYEDAKCDAEKLEYLMNEKRFVDIGLGFQENESGQLIESSGFNDALNGLTFLGYGLDEDGDPRNIYSIVQELRQIADSVPEGEDWSTDTYDKFKALVKKLEGSADDFKTEYTNMDAGTLKLKNNLALLEDNFYGLQEQYSAIEDVNMADAISSFLWAEYCYNAALKVGNSILSQTLMDYLN